MSAKNSPIAPLVSSSRTLLETGLRVCLTSSPAPFEGPVALVLSDRIGCLAMDPSRNEGLIPLMIAVLHDFLS